MTPAEPENINERRVRLLTEALLADPDPAGWTPARVQALYRADDDEVDINTCWGWLRYLTIVAPVNAPAVAPAAEPDTLFGLGWGA